MLTHVPRVQGDAALKVAFSSHHPVVAPEHHSLTVCLSALGSSTVAAPNSAPPPAPSAASTTTPALSNNNNASSAGAPRNVRDALNMLSAQKTAQKEAAQSHKSEEDSNKKSYSTETK